MDKKPENSQKKTYSEPGDLNDPYKHDRLEA